MRKLRGTGSAPAGNGSAGSNTTTGSHSANGGSSLPTGGSEDAMLDARVQISLHTLKKLFDEYKPLSEQERDLKLYQMLPLFCKVSACECARVAGWLVGWLEEINFVLISLSPFFLI